MTPDAPTRMDDAVRKVLAALPEDADESVRQRPDDPDLRTWSYLPGDRPGLCLEAADDALEAAVHELVDLAHSEHGARLVRDAMAVERLRRLAATGKEPAGDRYWWRLVGEPGSAAAWGWRLNGHHVGVHVVVDGDRVTYSPHFVGSEPARLPAGPGAGLRILGPEEDLARDLLRSLDPDQRRRAVASDLAPADILTGMDPVADPSAMPPGLGWESLDAHQRTLFERLVDRYLARLPDAYARACRAEAMAGPEALAFGWAGGEEVGDPHYYCVRSAAFLIEYDNTQDGANHAHSVLRHLRDDFGGDALRRHHRDHH